MKTKSLVRIARHTIFNEFLLKCALLVVMLLSASPFIHMIIAPYVKIFLGWGLILFIYLLGSHKLQYFNKYRILMGVFIFCYGISILINKDLNFTSNIKTFLYMIVVLGVIFFVSPEKTEKEILREIKIALLIFTAVAFVLAGISLGTFIFSVKGHATYEGQWVYYGMFENRLWGLYNPSTGSAINTLTILFLTSYLLFQKVKHKAAYAYFAVNIAVQYICLLLTNSRTALYTLLIGVAVLIFLRCQYQWCREKRTLAAFFKGIICALIGCIIIFITVTPMRSCLAYVPGIVKVTVVEHNHDSNSDEQEIEKEELTRLEELEDRPGGILTGRTVLWKAGMKTFKESPVFGVCKENIPERVQKHLDDEYWLRDLQRGGLHNVYLTVLVASGIIGFIPFLIFLIILVFKCFKHIFIEHVQAAPAIVFGLISVIGVILIMECLEGRILYQMNIFYIVFWCVAGYLLYLLDSITKKKDAKNEH